MIVTDKQMALLFWGGMAIGAFAQTALRRVWRWANEFKRPPGVVNEHSEPVRSCWIERLADTQQRENVVQDKIRRMEADRDARVEAFRKSIPPK